MNLITELIFWDISSMIRRLDKRNYHSVRMVIHTEPEESNNPWCSTCAAVGKLSRLSQRIYLDSKGKLIVPQPPDADNYYQCWNCGLVIPTREAQMEGKISPIPWRSTCRESRRFQ